MVCGIGGGVGAVGVGSERLYNEYVQCKSLVQPYWVTVIHKQTESWYYDLIITGMDIDCMIVLIYIVLISWLIGFTIMRDHSLIDCHMCTMTMKLLDMRTHLFDNFLLDINKLYIWHFLKALQCLTLTKIILWISVSYILSKHFIITNTNNSFFLILKGYHIARSVIPLCQSSAIVAI